MTTRDEPVIEQRKVFQPFVDVFNAAIQWHKADTYSKPELANALDKECEKALNDIAQFAIDSYLETLPRNQKNEEPKP